MRRFSAARVAVFFTVALTHIAAAADMPVKAPRYVAPPSVPMFSWTGFYVGGTVGGAWTKADVSLDTVNGASPLYIPSQIPGLDAIGSPSISASNVIFGAKVGYNQQWASFVLGLEGDISSFRFNRSAFTTGNPFFIVLPPAVPNVANFNTNVATSWLATVRARFGYAVDRFLFYGTGGAAFSNVSFSNAYNGHSPLGAGDEFEATSASQTKTGWVAGGGIDYALTTNWIVSVEYLHVDLGSITASGLATSGNANTATMNFSTTVRSDLVRGGVAYKF
jgi:outer membrane immunogenic protein